MSIPDQAVYRGGQRCFHMSLRVGCHRRTQAENKSEGLTAATSRIETMEVHPRGMIETSGERESVFVSEWRGSDPMLHGV